LHIELKTETDFDADALSKSTFEIEFQKRAPPSQQLYQEAHSAGQLQLMPERVIQTLASSPAH
jgi:hypothetical protein